MPPYDPTEVPLEEPDCDLLAEAALPSRYTDLGAIGRGGMAEVRRVHDATLGVQLAMKLLPLARSLDPRAARRFLAEARLTAQLRHPAVVAVQDVGRLDDGRLWFTMAEVEGRTWAEVASTLPLERHVAILMEVADAVAYAHGRGAIHRDLKPSNVMIGRFGEVRVLDWGIAQWADEPEATGAEGRLGTPRWMAPEQEAPARITPAVDVWALGTLAAWLLQTTTTTDARLTALADAARRVEPTKRPAAADVADEARAWLERTRRCRLADAGLAQADALAPRLDELRAQVEHLEEQRRDLACNLLDHAPVSEKQALWAVEEASRALQTESAILEAEWVQLLRGNLAHLADHAPTHRRLAAYHADRLRRAARAGRALEGVRHERFLRNHDDGRYAELLSGQGSFTVHTEVPCEAVLVELIEQDRRLVPGARTSLGPTPLNRRTVRAGRHLLLLRAKGRPEVCLPLQVHRGEHTQEVAPGEAGPWCHPVPNAVIPGMRYIPAGWFTPGEDPHAIDPARLGRVWIDAFWMAIDPVTVGEYLAFLDAVPEAQLEPLLPRAGRAFGESRQPLVERVEGHFRPVDARPLSAPITSIRWEAMRAYARWRGEQLSLGLRLPQGVEWERAARGADARWFPTGVHLEPTATVMVSSTPHVPRLQPVEALDLDRSPYGIRGMTGNVREAMENAWTHLGGTVADHRVVRETAGPEAMPEVRGGGYTSASHGCRAASRAAMRHQDCLSTVGFRLAL